MRVRQRKKEAAFDFVRVERGTESENYVGALYGFIKQEVKWES
jgi:hypothetical protein